MSGQPSAPKRRLGMTQAQAIHRPDPGATFEGERRNPGSLNSTETPSHWTPERPDKERLILGCLGHEGGRTAGPCPGTSGTLERGLPACLHVWGGLCTPDTHGTLGKFLLLTGLCFIPCYLLGKI